MKRGRLILVGSGEFTPAMDDLDREILAGVAKPRARVAIVPTASGLEDTPDSWAELGKTHFAALGADVVAVMVLRRDHARERRWIDALRDVSTGSTSPVAARNMRSTSSPERPFGTRSCAGTDRVPSSPARARAP